MPAIDTASVSAPVAVVLLYIHRRGTDLARCAFVRAGPNHICGIGSCMWQHQSPGYGNTETAVLSLVRFAAGLHEMGSGV